MKLKRVNWYGFKHKKVSEMLSGDLTFCNSFCVNDEYAPVAVYKAKNPDRSKGHKDYVLLQADGRRGMIRGMDKDEIEKHRYQLGIHCHTCDEVVFSVMRHDMRYCKCGKAFADGGKDYLRTGGDSISKTSTVKIDLIASKVIEILRD